MYASEKGFLKMKKSWGFRERLKGSVKQVLTPPFVAVSNHAHQLAGSM
jgi:hypothetical protein